ncbi:MAG: Trm112 family protein [Mariprofundus sp.]|nr:Trm112 family protein [Mariprofundus sp.]
MIDQALMEILACPKCKGEIHYNDSKNGLVCDRCKLEYPIRDDIPVMLIDEAAAINA